MNTDQSLLQFGLVPQDEHLPTIRSLLEQEAEAERSGNERQEDLALLCCVQLFSRGYVEDVLRIWQAKQAGMDLGAYLGVQLLCGAGLQETKNWLESQATDVAAAALTYILKCEKAGDFVDFTPQDYIQYYRDYFSTK